jgi:hypothetical protein
MRPDIVPGLSSPTMNFPTRPRNAKALRLQGRHPMVLALSRGCSCPKGTTGNLNCLLNSIVSLRLAIVGWNRLGASDRDSSHDK